MPTRRGLLAGIAAGIGTAGLGSLAGCAAVPQNRGTAPAYAGRLYDPDAVLNAPNRTFLSYDVGTLYDRRDLFPDAFASTLEEFDRRYGTVSVPDLGRLTAQGYWQGDAVPGDGTSAAASAVLEGSFEPGELLAEVRGVTDEPVEAAGTVGNTALYSVGTRSARTAVTLALGGQRVAAGASMNASGAGETAVRTALDAEGGGSGYYRGSDTAARIVDALGDATAVAGLEVGSLDLGNASFDDPNVAAVVSGFQGLGAGTTVRSDEVRSRIAAVYEAGETPTAAELRGFLEWYEGKFGDGTAPSATDVEVSVEGRTALATTSGDPGSVFLAGRPARVGAAVEVLLLSAAAFIPLVPGRTRSD